MDERSLSFPSAKGRQRNPVVLGILVIAMLWAGVAYKATTDWQNARRASDETNEAFAVMFEENVLRAIGEIDKALLYMRHGLETRGQADFFSTIGTTKDLLSDIIVQVAVIDADGIMRASNAGPQPPPPTDLSDRPHFKVHVRVPDDTLYIGQPLVGRASGRLSVQFSRRFLKPDGSFGGVVVASLDPYHFSRFIDKIDANAKAAISLIGEDGVVRTDGGADDGIRLGENISGTPLYADLQSDGRRSFEVQGRGVRGTRVVTARKVRGQPLWVTVSVPKSEIYAEARSTLEVDSSVAALLTLLIALSTVKLIRIEIKRSEAEASYLQLALRDPLTDLPNRRVFQAELEAIAKKPGSPAYAVMFLDIDHFKFVNDTLGHAVGDQLLINIGRRLAMLLGHGAVLARLGGDEFAVVITHSADRDLIDRLAGQICDATAEPFDIEQHQVRSGVSIGIAIGPDDGSTADEILMAADLALYAAKTKARGIHAYYDRAMSEGISERRRLESELRAALEAGELELWYQPSVTLKTSRVAGFEALARWRHPIRGHVPPNVFIAIAEECGFIQRLGQWALTQACREATTWPGAIKVAVNLSPLQFAAPNLVEMITDVLSTTGLPANRLELEITEQLLLDNGERTLRTLTSLKALGISIAMDDFGTGYSSLLYLRKFPFDKIKIDQSFVRDLSEADGSLAIVRAVVDIARSRNMATTAEGVETAEQRDQVSALGCDEVQGYFYSRPVPAIQIPDVIIRCEKAGLLAA